MSRLTRPFAQLNLRYNPFGELEHETLVELAVVDLAAFAELLRSPRQALQFVGDHGRGKTTRLRVLHAAYAASPYKQFYPQSPEPSFASAAQYFIDSIDYLSRRARRRLYAAADSFAATTHSDLSAEFANAGYTVTSVQVSGVDRQTLAEIIQRRIEHARRALGPLPAVEPAEIDALIARFGDDLRAIEEALYEHFQALSGATLAITGGITTVAEHPSDTRNPRLC
jgi:hypothetical protein